MALGGALVSDSVAQLTRLFPDTLVANAPAQMLQMVKQLILSEELQTIKERNRQNILENHTYVHRVKEMLEW